MVYSYCTLFDSLYLSRALAMHESLRSKCPDFRLYIFPFDDNSKEILEKLNLDCVTIIPLAEFENPELLSVKATRSKGEYCWTCTPAIIAYCIEHFNLDHCTYIDADLYFFSNPNLLIEEMAEKSILITEHRYTKKYDQSAISGIYCVQFITFRNDQHGLAALYWWRDRCLEWCFARREDGKFGDQMYLDDWTERFEGVHVLKHLGGGVAPWNVQQYEFEILKGELFLRANSNLFPLVFYHFHYVKSYANDKVDLGNFKLSKHVLHVIYRPYLTKLIEIENMLSIKVGFARQIQKYYYKYASLKPLHRAARFLLGIYNVYSIKNLINGKAD